MSLIVQVTYMYLSSSIYWYQLDNGIYVQICLVYTIFFYFECETSIFTLESDTKKNKNKIKTHKKNKKNTAVYMLFLTSATIYR